MPRGWSTVSRLILLLLALPAFGAELEGVQLEQRVQVDGRELQLNGAAVRTRVIVKVYVAGLYLPSRAATAQAAIDGEGPKRIVLVMLRDASAQQFVESIERGMRANNSVEQIAEVRPQTEALMSMIRAVGHAKTGMRVVLDYSPSLGGTTLYVDGTAQGPAMAGKAFNQALLRIWLGDDPVQPDLKEALLGGLP